MEDHGQGCLRVYVYLVDLTASGCPAVTDGLDGDLARLQQWPRREDGPVRARAAGCGAQPVRRAARGPCMAAAAVRCRGKASGRRVVRRVPRARRARLLLLRPTLPPSRVRGYAPLGARRAGRALDLTCDMIGDPGGVRPADLRDLLAGWADLRTNRGCRVARCRMSGR
jgi:hypothetical protein